METMEMMERQRTHDCGCGCGGGGACGCTTLPAEFVRLRYYYGQRLGQVELSDEQAYHVGKHRLHNARAHGAGVLCGLRPERWVFPQGAPAATPTQVLRVTRGIAMDCCGRELVVPGDYCIDVAAWYRENRRRREVAEWTRPVDPGDPAAPPRPTPRLWVAVRYRECPSDPAASPRDPCGCDAGGCEYGRTRESFELRLLTDTEHDDCDCTPAYSPDDVRTLLADAAGDANASGSPRDRFVAAVGRLAARDCSVLGDDSWLCLGSVDLSLDDPADGTPTVVDIAEPDISVGERVTLLPTAALQELLAQLAAGASGAGTLGDGPRLAGLAFESDALDAGALDIAIALARDPIDPGDAAIAPATFRPDMVALLRFDEGAGSWEDHTPPAARVTIGGAPSPRIRLEWPGGGADADSLREGLYRLTIAQPFDTPAVDVRMRPLQPLRFARHFRLQPDAGHTRLTLADRPF